MLRTSMEVIPQGAAAVTNLALRRGLAGPAGSARG